MAMETWKCEWCGETMAVRSADRNRGWGRFCSKSCKASKQSSTRSRPRRELAPGEFYATNYSNEEAN